MRGRPSALPSVGRRPGRRRHEIRAFDGRRRSGSSPRSWARLADQSSAQPTSSSTNATHLCRPTSRQPTLRAAAGPRPPLRTHPHAHRQPSGTGASGRTDRGGRRRSRRPSGGGPPDAAIVCTSSPSPSTAEVPDRPSGRLGCHRLGGVPGSGSHGNGHGRQQERTDGQCRPEPTRHSSASYGLSTIGRPAVLRLVLTTTGTPVRCAKARAARDGGIRIRRRRSGSERYPSTWATACSRSRQCGATSCTNSMYGLGSGPREKISPARSARTIGATGGTVRDP